MLFLISIIQSNGFSILHDMSFSFKFLNLFECFRLLIIFVILCLFKLERTKNEIVFTFDDHDETYKYEYLGYNDYKNNIWIWAWVLADFDDYETKECKYLLNYGLKLEPKSTTTDQLLFKGILVNSRIKIVEDIQQEVNLSLYSYLLKNRIKFIFKNKIYEDISSSNKIINEDDDNYIIQYILIK